jgi:hypothetical protein
MRRTTLEKEVQRQIEEAIGSEPDLLLLRNSVGQAEYTDEQSGRTYFVPYGLGKGSPDLVGLLRVGNRAMWFCLEVKPSEGELEDAQKRCHAIWRRFGGFVETVRSADDARAALDRARRWAR